MTGTLLLILPDAPDAPIAWRRYEDDRLANKGDDLIARAADGPEDRVIAIAPAGAVKVDWAELPGLAPAQARAAARLLASENSVTPLDGLHVALGKEEEGGDRAIASVERLRLEQWVARAQFLGFDPDAVVPASLLLPRPDEGYIRGEVAGQPVIRSRNSAFLDEPELTDRIVNGAPVTALAPAEAERAMLTILADPPVDLRQGIFAKRTPWAIDWKLVRRLVWMGVAILGVTILIHIALILKYSTAADATELRTRALAQSALPGGAGDTNAVVALDERLAAARGGGAGFARSASAIYAAIRAVPNVELTAFDFAVDGSLRFTLAATTAEDITAFQRQLERYGFDGTATTPRVEAGRQIVEMTVKLP